MNETKQLSPHKTDDLARNAFRVSLGTAVFLTILTIIFHFVLDVPPSSSNPLTPAAQIGITALAALFSAILAYRRRPTIGIWVLLSAIYAVPSIATYYSPAISFLVMGIMLVLSSGLVSMTLIGKSLNWAMGTSLVMSLILLFIGFISPFSSAANDTSANMAYVALPVFLIYGFFIIRQFRTYSLRVKLIIGFVFIGLIGAVFSYGSSQFSLASLTEDVLPSQQAFGQIAWRSHAVQSEALQFLNAGEEESLEELTQNIDALTAVSAQVAGLGKDPDEAEDFMALAGNANEMGKLAQTLVASHQQTLAALETMEAAEEALELLLAEGQTILDAEITRNIADQNLEELEDDAIPAQGFLAEFGAGAQTMQAETLEFVATSEFAAVAEFKASRERLATARDEISTTFESDEPGGGLLVAKFQAVALQIETAGLIVIASHTKTIELLDAFEDVEAALSSRLTVVELWINRDVIDGVETTNNVNATAVIVVVILSAGLGALMANFMTRPVSRLVAVAQKLGAGDYSAQVQVETNDEIGALATAFNDMAAHLQQTLGQLESRARQLETSAEVSRRLSTILDEQELVTAVVTSLQQAFNYYHVHIYLLNQTDNTLIMAGGTGDAGAQLLANNHAIAVGRGLVGSTAQTNTANLVSDVTENEAWVANPLLPETRSEIAVPIAIGDTVLGVLDVQSNVTDGLGQPDQELLQSITNQIAIALQNARQYDEVQRSQQSIRERETLLRTIIDSTPDWIFVKDQDHCYQMVNQSYANAFHMTPADFIGQNDLDIGFPEEIVKGNPEKGIRGFWADDNEIMAEGKMKVIDVEPAVVDGEERFLNTTKAPLKDSAGKVTGVVGFVHDITNRIHNEEVVRERETLLRTIIDSTPDWIFVKDLEHRYLMVNQGYANSFHMMPDDFIGKNDLEIGFPEEIVKGSPEKGIRGFWASDREIMDRGELMVIDEEPAVVDGEDRFLNTVKAPLKDAAGDVRGIVGFVHDITSRKQIEAALQKEQERVQNILESISVPLVISKIADGTVAYVNEPLAEIIRVPRDELMGQVTPDFYHDPADRQAYLMALREQGRVENYDLRLKRGNGELFWALISGQVIDFQGEPAIINSVIDINERREAQTMVARRATEMETVADLGTIAATILEPDELLQQVVDLTKERFDLYHAHIYLLDEDRQVLALTNGAGETGHTMVAEGRQILLSQEQSLVARAARSRKGVVTNDVQAEPGFLPHPLLPDTRAEMAVPLISGNEVQGVLDVQADTVNRFTAEDISIFTTLAAQISVALQNALRYGDSQKALDELTRLQRVMAREGWQAFLLAQERPFFGYSFNAKGTQLMADKDDEGIFSAATNGYVSEAETETETDAETAVVANDVSLSIPITVRGESIGQIGLRTPDGSPIPERSQLMLQTITQQMSEALERARLFEETETARSQTETLYAGSDQVIRATSIDDILEAVVNSTDLQKMERTSVLLFEKPWAQSPELMTIVANWTQDGGIVLGQEPITLPISQFPSLRNSTQGEIMIVRDLEQDTQLDETVRAFFTQIQIRSYVGVPLIVGEQWIGYITGQSAKPMDMKENAVRQIRSLVSQAATVIQGLRLFAAAEERAAEMALINKVVASVSGTLEVEEGLQMIADELASVIEGAQIGIALINTKRDHLTIVAEAYDVEKAGSSMGFVIPIEGNHLTQKVLQSRETVMVKDAQNDPLLAPVREGMKQRGVQTLYVIPMLAGNDVVGTVGIDLMEEDRELNEQQINLAETIVFQAATAVQNARLYTESQQRSDELSTINSISEVASSQLNTTELFNSVGTLLQETFASESVYFALYDNKESKISFPYFYSKEEGFHEVAPRTMDNGGLTAKIIETKKSLRHLWEQDLPQGDVEAAGAQVVGGGRLADSYIGVPMIVGREVIGVIGVSNYSEIRTYDEQDQYLLESLAGTIGVAIQNSRQFEAAQRRAERESLINMIGQKIQSATTVESALQTAVSELGQALKLKKAVVELTGATESNGHAHE